ncbi:MAG: UPF0307 protein [Lysobacteraceae bacterium]|nr:MAG: UPF0307 protein [Xanthomonadaceae bacterium]
MRGRDPETGAFLGPSRSQRKRDAEAVLELAAEIVALPQARLERLPMTDAIRAAVEETRRIRSHIAHKRQLHYLAKLMRREDEDWLQAVRAELGQDRQQARQEAARLHRIEQWRERLLDEGDAALGALAAAHPGIDRHRVRQLVRRAQEERLENRPPRAFRELFQLLRQALAESPQEQDATTAGTPPA